MQGAGSTTLRIGKLQQQIGDLKKDAQRLLDKKNETKDKVELERVNKEKKEKIKMLKRLAKKLRETYKDTKKERELKTAGNVLDGIEYHKAKKSKNAEAMPKVRKIRQAREEARNKYLGYLSLEEKYYRLDPPEVPGCLFLHERVINTYGLLSEEYLRLNTDIVKSVERGVDMRSDTSEGVTEDKGEEEDEEEMKEYMEGIRDKRIEWLNLTADKGDLYFALKDEIFDKTELKELEDEKCKVEGEIECIIKDALNENQLEMYEKSNDFMVVWSETRIKTKRMKERHKLLLHALATLKSETNLPIVEYLEAKYKDAIIINDYDTLVTLKNKNLYAIDLACNKMGEYKKLLEKIVTKNKYIMNNDKYLRNELYMYLTGEKVFRTPIAVSLEKENSVGIKQTGKYFVRWIKLTIEQQGERFESYARWYVDKFMIGKNLIPSERRLEMVEILASLLHESYKVKHMIYRDFAWKTKSGMIENVKILQYDKSSDEFKLKFSKKPKVNVDGESKAKVKKKAKGEAPSVFERATEINDVLLRYIIDKNSHLDEVEVEKSKVHKNRCLDLIKKELNMKSISALDRQKLFVKYTDMCYDIKNGIEETRRFE